MIIAKGWITLAFWMCSLDVRFTVECAFDVIFSDKNSKIRSKTHSKVKRPSKLHGSITLAFWMCSFDVCFTVKCVFNVIFDTENDIENVFDRKIHIQNASVLAGIFTLI
jgi:hypothetical protein